MRRDFEYLGDGEIYLDASCQSLRPTAVLEAMGEYYREYNSCGERVKYKWGVMVDEMVEATREKVLEWLGLSGRKYFVAFTLNTTYGINLILNQIRDGVFSKVVTSDIEHNSVFLSSIVFSKKHGIKRVVLTREADGFLPLTENFKGALVILNTVSNIDGRSLENVQEVVEKVHKDGGRIIIDAAQTMAHKAEILRKVEADAICFSAHKMYSASMGVMVVRRDFLEELEVSFIGGGMVDDVRESDYDLSYKSPNHVHTIFEAGVQAYGETVALGAAIDWLRRQDRAALEQKAERMYEFLAGNEKIHLINGRASTVLSFYVEGVDSHLLAESLSRAGVMARSGYFCCHYYLKEVMGYPPLLRFSLGYHNTEEDIEKVMEILRAI